MRGICGIVDGTSFGIEAGLFERQAIRRVAEAHASGREGHEQRPWIFMALEIWWRLFLSREDPP